MYKGKNVSRRQQLTEIAPTEQLTAEQAICMCRESAKHSMSVQVDARTWIELPCNCHNVEERINNYLINNHNGTR